MNDKKSIFKINLKKIDYCDLIGIEDCFEFKNKFYSVRCVSNSAEVKIIKINELLRIIWHSSSEDLLYLLRIIINRKKILQNEIINAVKNLEKKILFKFDIRYENLINYDQNIYSPKNSICLKDKIKNHYFINFTKNKKKENEVNRIVSAIKAKGYKIGLQEILDENVNFLSKNQTKLEEKIYRNQSAISLNILKNLLRDRQSIPHEFNFKKQNFTINIRSDNNDLENPISNRLSPISSKRITNYTSLKNNINSFREFSGLSNKYNKKNYLQIKRENNNIFYLSNNNYKTHSFQSSKNKKRNHINDIKKINSTIFNRIKSKYKNKDLNLESNMNFENNTIIKKHNLLRINSVKTIKHKLNSRKDSELFSPKNNVRMKKTMSMTNENIEQIRNKIKSAKVLIDKTSNLLKNNKIVNFQNNKNGININLSNDEYSIKNINEKHISSNDNTRNIAKEILKHNNVYDFLSIKKRKVHFFSQKIKEKYKYLSPDISKPSSFFNKKE